MGVTECPKPILSAFSLNAMESFFAARTLGGPANIDDLDAKCIDAWMVLDQELRKEQNDEQT